MQSLAGEMRILLVTGGCLYRNTGSTQRTRLLFQALQKFARVETLWLVETPEIAAEFGGTVTGGFNVVRSEALQPSGGILKLGRVRRGVALLKQSRPDTRLSAALAGLLDAGRYDAIVCRYFEAYFTTSAFRYDRVFVDIDDHPADTWQHVLDAKRKTGASALNTFVSRAFLALRLHLHQRAFKRCLPRAAACFVANPEDAARVPHRRTVYLPNIPVIEPAAGGAVSREENSLLVVGTWDWAPNRLGLGSFLNHAWPTIHEAVPAARLYIVGFGISDQQKSEWSAIPGIEVVGSVPSLAPWYQRAGFSIAPIEHGGGTNIKVLESLGYGRTVVVTSHASRGYAGVLEHEDAVLIANDWPAMAQNCIRLLRDKALRDRLESRGRAVVREQFSSERICRVIHETLCV